MTLCWDDQDDFSNIAPSIFWSFWFFMYHMHFYSFFLKVIFFMITTRIDLLCTFCYAEKLSVPLLYGSFSGLSYFTWLFNLSLKISSLVNGLLMAAGPGVQGLQTDPLAKSSDKDMVRSAEMGPMQVWYDLYIYFQFSFLWICNDFSWGYMDVDWSKYFEIRSTNLLLWQMLYIFLTFVLFSPCVFCM